MMSTHIETNGRQVQNTVANNPLERLHTYNSAGQLLSLKRGAVKKLCDTGRLQRLDVNCRVKRIKHSSIMAFIASL
jgi:hypothetical protein